MRLLVSSMLPGRLLKGGGTCISLGTYGLRKSAAKSDCSVFPSSRSKCRPKVRAYMYFPAEKASGGSSLPPHNTMYLFLVVALCII